MKIPRNTVVVFASVLVFSAFFWFDPFGFFNGKRPPALPRIDAATLKTYGSGLLGASGQPPATKAILDLFSRADLVVLADFPFLAGAKTMAAEILDRWPAALNSDPGSAIPGNSNPAAATTTPLYSLAPTAFLAVDFLLSADQAAIDHLMRAPTFDDQAAARLILQRSVALGSEEHLALLRAAWQANSQGRTLRVLALGAPVLPDAFPAPSEGLSEAEALARVYPQGLPDQFAADILERQVLQPGHQALVLLGRDSAWLAADDPGYTEELAKRGIPEARRTIRILFDTWGPRIKTVMFHEPWVRSTGSFPLAWPVDGLVDHLIRAGYLEAPSAHPYAVDLEASPLGTWPLRHSPMGVPDPGYRLKDLASLYVVAGLPGTGAPTTPLLTYIYEETLYLMARQTNQGIPPADVKAARDLLQNRQQEFATLQQALAPVNDLAHEASE